MDQLIYYFLERKQHLESIKSNSSLKIKLKEILSNDYIQSVEEQYRKDSISDPIIPEEEKSFEERFDDYIRRLEKEDG